MEGTNRDFEVAVAPQEATGEIRVEYRRNFGVLVRRGSEWVWGRGAEVGSEKGFEGVLGWFWGIKGRDEEMVSW